MENKLQITQDEISNMEGFNLDLLREATRQVELKIVDENARKERIDSRAYHLLSVFLGLIGVIFGAINIDYLQKNIAMLLTIDFTAVLITLGAACLLESIKSKQYGSVGTYPHSWLSKEYIKDYNDSNNYNNYILGIAIARILLACESNIKTSDESNAKRLKILNLSLVLCQIALLPFLVFFVTDIICHLPWCQARGL